MAATNDLPLGACAAECRAGAGAADRLIAPVATSVLRPMIVLPGNWRPWNAATLDAVLAHEIAHVARRDALAQPVSRSSRSGHWPSASGPGIGASTAMFRVVDGRAP